MNFKEYLGLVQHTRLLFENEMDLRKYLNRKSRSGRNGLAARTRSENAIKRDFDILEKYSISATNGAFGTSEEGALYNLGYLLDDYEMASSSGYFFTPSNSRPEKGRGIFYINEVDKPEKLQSLIYDFFTSSSHDETALSLYSALALNVKDRTSIVRNYYGTIGLLLLLKAIPFCSPDSRPNRSKMDLDADTEKAFSFFEGLFLKDGPMKGSLVSEFERLRQSSRKKTWCRLKLIYSSMMLLSRFAVQMEPSLLEELNIPDNERLLKSIPFRSGFWKSMGEDQTYYKVVTFPEKTPYSAYLFRYSSKLNTWERYGLTFYANRVVHIDSVDSYFKYLDSEGKCGNFSTGHYRLENNLIQFDSQIKGMAFICIQLVDEKEVPLRIRDCSRVAGIEKGIENIRVIAIMGIIFLKAIVLDDGKGGLYKIEPTESNHLKEVIPTLRIGDRVSIQRYCDRDFLVFDTKTCHEVLEVTTEGMKQRYGITYLQGK